MSLSLVEKYVCDTVGTIKGKIEPGKGSSSLDMIVDHHTAFENNNSKAKVWFFGFFPLDVNNVGLFCFLVCLFLFCFVFLFCFPINIQLEGFKSQLYKHCRSKSVSRIESFEIRLYLLIPFKWMIPVPLESHLDMTKFRQFEVKLYSFTVRVIGSRFFF